MTHFDTLIKHGLIITAADRYHADIGIKDGRIVALGQGLEGADEVIDADGLWVMPGGIDAHCHLDQPLGDGAVMADDFHTGTRSAACGGTTTVIPFAAQQKGQSLRAAVEDYHQRSEGLALIDYAFHMIVTDPTERVLKEELPALIEEGYSSFKIYLTYDDLKLNDRQVLEVLALARREGGMVMVHAENADCIAYLTELLESQGKTAPVYHGEAHSAIAEREATHRAISLAELIDVPLLIVHVSGPEAIEQIRWAQGRGLRVYGETCPQYLMLTAADLDKEGFEGAKCVCSPPPRDKKAQEAVWQALESGVFQVFSSDHAPFRYEDAQGKKLHGEQADFHHIPNGIPGLETRLSILFSEGVLKQRIDATRFVALTATNPAKIYGLYPRKGTIAIGSDADLTLWDSKARVTIRNDELNHAVDYTPYEGIELGGKPVLTLCRGTVVSRDGKPTAPTGHGLFLKCDKPQPAKPRGTAKGF
ncbi:dihydropyrimidinase [Halomonas urumqiensis]|uniref:Dihydropyrimidinase n=1 Tax=Halomonas urumqiensis TaxID=1684789 RepID=A0A2N7UM95_9GAMM|nr:dihydropyrimidinase [Halomonas urumqiensis]PMR81529.1 dihydropyrimidinase [Halomonas urumqiensis]PTB02165.1 dihydropyrimidinase [Halomonas urumqiensis]GHE21622.1 dihydropyrimidinase [Halomonas urumqiensis]